MLAHLVARLRSLERYVEQLLGRVGRLEARVRELEQRLRELRGPGA